MPVLLCWVSQTNPLCECRYAECRSAVCHCAECRGAVSEFPQLFRVFNLSEK
jgi:hypothetical protein